MSPSPYEIAGRYLAAFAELEAAVNATIGAALSLNETQTAILSVNMSFRDKIGFLRTCANLLLSPQDHALRFDKSLGRMLERYKSDRNLVAHNQFRHGASGGIAFLGIRAKRHFDVPIQTWDEANVAAKLRELEMLKVEATTLASEFQSQHQADARWPTDKRLAQVLPSLPDS